MARYSQHFKALNKEIGRLRRHFLPQQLSRYSSNREDEIRDKTRAYLVLVHAEIESYLEKVIRDVINAKYQEWDAGRKCSRVVVALVASARGNFNEASLDDYVKKCYESAHEVISNNHGIRAHNLKKLFRLLGIDTDEEIDQTWLNDMDTFGKLRGDIAHQSRQQLTHFLDPKDAKQRVDNLLKGLRDLDRKLQRLP